MAESNNWDRSARKALANCYKRGLGVEKDKAKAKQILKEVK